MDGCGRRAGSVTGFDAHLVRPARTGLAPGQVLAGNFPYQALMSNVHISVSARMPVRNTMGISTI